MGQLIETRWKRFGNDRVYVRDANGNEIGHVDLKNRTVAATAAGHEPTLEDCLRRWAANEARRESTDHAEAEPIDLAENVAGAAAWAERERINSQAPVRNFLARLLGMKTNERAWRVGAKGEEKVARHLAKLGPEWRVLHAVPIGEHGSDIDHVVIGPPGVITINTKCHPRGDAWVAGRAVMVNGQKTDYLRNSHYEAKRTTELLSVAFGKPVVVRAAIVFVDLQDIKIKEMPSDVHVASHRRVVDWLQSLPITTAPADVEKIFSRARISTTWSTA